MVSHRRTTMKCRDGNIVKLLDTQAINAQQGLNQDYKFMRTFQMHSSLVPYLALDNVMEGHQGCVNALSWNAEGSMLLSGSDDTRVNLWEYSSRKLVHSIDSGHTANIFCVQFVPETCDDMVVSGAGDSEVRVHRLSRSNSGGPSHPHFQCHTRRVKKLAVEDGNPHVIWSSSEDGTLRQHDLREGLVCPPNGTGASDHECRNVLLDLRSAAKRSLADPPKHNLSLKTCAINRTRPHQLLVGGSDAFARLYDRRMLPPPSSSRILRKPPPCVYHICPAHLSENTRAGLHLTHVTFSPNGMEVLLSYSGEHVYLMDVNGRIDDTVTYTVSDLPRRYSVEPVINGSQSVPVIDSSTCVRHPKLSECHELLDEASKAMKEDETCHAINITSEVIETGYHVLDSETYVDCLCIRAEAFLKRCWKNDVHMAIRDCNKARSIDPRSSHAHYLIAKALYQLKKFKEALDFALRAEDFDSSNKDLSEFVSTLKKTLADEEASKANGNTNHTENDQGRDSSKTEGNVENLSPDSRCSERDDSDFDDDMEMEMEIEMLVGAEDEGERESGPRPGSSLNLRLRRRVTSSRDRNTKTQSSLSGASSDNEISEPEIALDMRQRYVGHCNVGTDIKQANFLGEKGEFVASGSDDGRWFIWDKRTGTLLKLLKGDENVVNCVQCHPFDAAIATSGIDHTIKMWSPCAPKPSLVGGGIVGPETGDVLQIMKDNQHKMLRPREMGFPFELLQRFRVPTERGMRPPLECTQS